MLKLNQNQIEEQLYIILAKTTTMKDFIYTGNKKSALKTLKNIKERLKYIATNI